jgi:oxygen-independent coproporphyrinogen-3 oxidase
MTTDYEFAAELVGKYDRPGPRYTSYPTATQFTPEFSEQSFCEHIRRSNAEPIPRHLSLYVHVPYCFSPCFYCGCNRVITRDLTKGHRYVERLVREIAAVGSLFDRDREVVQLHFGGGTPNFLRPHQLGEIVESIGNHFHISAAQDRDFSIEIDPRFIGDQDIAAYAALGFNRASLGVQDFDRDVQEAVNRVQSVEQTLAVIDACRANGFRSINVDLIYGLPKQTLAGFERTLETVLAARPDRLAIYSYAHLPEMFKAQNQIDADALPSPTLKLALLQLAIDKLAGAGYEYIGMDHFSLPTDALAKAQRDSTLQRNFMGYTTHANNDLVGLGVSAISSIGDCFSQNVRDLPTWEARLDHGDLPVWRGCELGFDDLLRADLIRELMCFGRIDIAALERRYEIDFATYFAADLQRLRQAMDDGLVSMDAKSISATSRGRLLLRIIAMCFDRYLNDNVSSKTRRFSRAI